MSGGRSAGRLMAGAGVTLALLSRLSGVVAQESTCVIQESQKLIALETVADDRLGASVSMWKAWFVVGAWRAGAAYVFRRGDNDTPLQPQDDTWVEEAKLTTVDGGAAALFGWAVSISGDRVIIGARSATAVARRSGAAYVFRRDNNDTPLDEGDDLWVEEARLTASDGAADDDFGVSVSIFGDFAITGAPGTDDFGDASGSAYVFRRDDNGTPDVTGDDIWIEVDKLVASDGAAGDAFGNSVSISNRHAIVGAWHDDDAGERSGSAYVFVRLDNGTPTDLTDDVWMEQAKLTADDASPFDDFGIAVSVSVDAAVVGSWLDDDHGSLSGSVYVFRRDDSETPREFGDDSWVQEAKLTASDAAAGDEFGKSVVIRGDRLVVGAFEDDDACPPDSDPNCDSGSSYVFERQIGRMPENPNDDWIETVKLTASDAAAGSFFGRVGMSGEWIVAGALDDGAGENAGAAYVYYIGLRPFEPLCVMGPGKETDGPCCRFDLDLDDDVDLLDYALAQNRVG